MFRSRFGKLGVAGFAAITGVILVVATAGAHQTHIFTKRDVSSVTGLTSTTLKAEAEADQDAAADADTIEAAAIQKEAAQKALEQQQQAAAEAAADQNEETGDNQTETGTDTETETGDTGAAKIMSGDETNDHRVGAATTTTANWKVQPK